jgi:hypothetical protein
VEQIDHQRIEVLLKHWHHHNREHTESYENWAQRLRQGGWTEIAELLEEAARLTREINNVLDRAGSVLKPS